MGNAGLDVLLDEDLQPWLLELNQRPSMDIYDTEEAESMVDVMVKGMVMREALAALASKRGFNEKALEHYRRIEMQHEGAAHALAAVAAIYEELGGAQAAFNTRGVRKILKRAGPTSPLRDRKFLLVEVDPLVDKFKQKESVKILTQDETWNKRKGRSIDDADLGVLQFTEMLAHIATSYVAYLVRPEDDGKQREKDIPGMLPALVEFLKLVGAM